MMDENMYAFEKSLNIRYIFSMLCQSKAMKEVISFIAENDLNSFREKIMENTKKIIDLLEERAEISKKIYSLKKILNKDIRDTDRELEIVRTLNIKNSATLKALNYLFEYSLSFQEDRKLQVPWERLEISNKTYLFLTGERFFIELFTGIFLGGFGKKIQVLKEIPENLETSFILSGSHIVKVKKAENSLKLYLSHPFVEDFANLFLGERYGSVFIPVEKLGDYENMDLVIL